MPIIRRKGQAMRNQPLPCSYQILTSLGSISKLIANGVSVAHELSGFMLCEGAGAMNFTNREKLERTGNLIGGSAKPRLKSRVPSRVRRRLQEILSMTCVSLTHFVRCGIHIGGTIIRPFERRLFKSVHQA
jgi:hypothetical protein